jgi:hypothetical protein
VRSLTEVELPPGALCPKIEGMLDALATILAEKIFQKNQ